MGGYNYPTIPEFIDFPEVLRLRLNLRILNLIAIITASLLLVSASTATTSQTKSTKSTKSASSSHKSSKSTKSSKSSKTSSSKSKKKSAKATSHGQHTIDQERALEIQQALDRKSVEGGK